MDRSYLLLVLGLFFVVAIVQGQPPISEEGINELIVDITEQNDTLALQREQWHDFFDGIFDLSGGAGHSHKHISQPKPQYTRNEHQHEHDEEVDPLCLDADQTFDAFDENQDGFLDTSEFRLATAHVFVMLWEACTFEEETSCLDKEPTISQVWGYSFLSVTIISILSLLGVSIVVCSKAKESTRDRVMQILIGFAVGALLGDSLIHLLPGIFIPDEQHPEGLLKPHGTVDNLGLSLTIFASIIFFFLLERILHNFHAHVHTTQLQKDDKDQNKEMHNYVNSVEVSQAPSLLEDGQASSTGEDSQTEKKDSDNHSGDVRDKKGMFAKVATYGWLNLIADCFHNFTDGLAIGSVFTTGLSQGLATSVAVAAHEIPSELGDFAILIKAGFTVKQALVLNLISSLSAYIGWIIGASIGSAVSESERWILAVTVGSFLYIALADMVPELMKVRGKMITFLQVLGVCLGVFAMIVITFIESALPCA